MRLVGQFITATITRVSFDKIPLYDVRTNDGAFFRGIPTKSAGNSFCPLSVDDSVLLLFPNGLHDLPYIIGADVRNIEESTPTSTIQADYEPDALDTQIRQNNEVLSLGASGTTLDTAVGFRVQVPADGALRISRSGQSENNVIQAQPFIDSLFSHLSALEATISAMQTQITTLASAQGIVLPPPVPPPSSTAAKVDAETTISDALKIP